jgi:GldM N-terminal domain
MIKIITLLLLTSAAASGCQSPSNEISKAFKTVDNSLEKSSVNIDSANNSLLKKVGNKSGCGINKMADSLNIFMQHLKEEVKLYSSEKFPSNNAAESALDDLETSNKIMIENKKGDVLFEKLMNFNQAALNCDTSKELRKEITKTFDAGFFSDKNKFNEFYFKNTPTVAALTMLSSFQNKIKNIQYFILSSAAKSELMK